MGYTFLDNSYLILAKGIPESNEIIQLYKEYEIKPEIKLTDNEFNERFAEEVYSHPEIANISPGSVSKEKRTKVKPTKLVKTMKLYYQWSREIIRILETLDTVQSSTLDAIAALLHTIIAEIKSNSRYLLYLEHMITPAIENKLHRHITETSLKTTILVIHYAVQTKLSYHHFVELAMGALLHNIGLLRIPESILFEKEKLNEEDKKHIALVPVHGYKIAKALNCSPAIRNTILQSREAVDGSGYPLGLPESKISDDAKTVAACSAFASLISQRNYRAEHTPHEAMIAIVRQVNKRLSSFVIQELVRILSMYPLGSVVEIEGNRHGIVVESDARAPRAPFVAVHMDKEIWLSKPITIATRTPANKILGTAAKSIQEQFSERFIPTEKELMEMKI